jgi:hypothetical protein
MADIRMIVKSTGPVFDGRAQEAVTDFLHEAQQEVANEGVKDIHEQLGRVLRHPTGHYQSTIHVAKSSLNPVVTDGTVYGPWLEGVGSRNKTTRFKGYATFRRITQQLQAKASTIAERVLPKYLSRMQ